MTTCADWITRDDSREDRAERPLCLVHEFEVESGVRRARLLASALGWYRAFVNGEDQTGPALVPRWTPFDHYVEYQEYDVTEALSVGPNRIGLVVADGRFRGSLGAADRQAVYGDRLAAWAELEIEFVDGRIERIVTDSSWSAGFGPIVRSDPKHGEVTDMRLPNILAESDLTHLPNAVTLDEERRLIPEEVGRVTEIAVLSPVEITRSRSGSQIVDFGQNASGVVRIRLTGKPGQVVRLTHSEVLTPDGEVDTKYLTAFGVMRQSAQVDEITLDGNVGWWQPWFTIHGFRYVEVDGLDADIGVDDIEFVVLSTRLEETGSFGSSDGRLEQLYENVRWSMRSNFTDTPTDCPTRERSGWTGDAQIFASTAAVYADVDAYFRRFLRNLAAEQLPDGRVPMFIPAEASDFSGGMPTLFKGLSASAGWGDAAVLIPWTLYWYYGDADILSTGYSAAVRWVEYLRSRAERQTWRRRSRRGRVDPALERHLVDSGMDFGEWMRPGESFPGSLADSILRSGAVVATAYYEHSTRMLGRMAGVIGKQAQEEEHLRRAHAIRTAWRQAFIGSDGPIGMDRQDDYVRALAFGLLDDDEISFASDRLAELVRDAGYHLGTGFLSTPSLLDVLCDSGHAEVAFDVLLQSSAPSWLDQVRRGATTVWESWEGYTKSGAPTKSHNHYSLGAVSRFLVERVAGIAPASAGYDSVLFRPGLGSGLSSASASVGTPHGEASISWQRDAGVHCVDVDVPDGASGQIELPDGPHQVGPGTHSFVETDKHSGRFRSVERRCS